MNKGEYFDLNYMVSICDGDWQFMKEMIETFLNDTPGTITALQEHAHRKEWKQVAETAHKFKTSLMFMGIQSLHGTIREIEKSGKEEIETGHVHEKIIRVDEICKMAMTELRSFLESHP